MGANTSSAPRIATMNNPTCSETIILISDEVASRIDGNRRQLQQQQQQNQNQQKTPPQSSTYNSPMQATPPPPPSNETFICKNCNAEKCKDEKVALQQPTTATETPPTTTTATSTPTPQPTPTAVSTAKPMPPQNIYEQKCKEIEKEEFDKTLEMLDKTIGKPIDWTEEHKVEVKNLQSDLLKCYNEYPKEPLRCYRNAKEYQDFVFEEQYKTILKQTLGAGDSSEK